MTEGEFTFDAATLDQLLSDRTVDFSPTDPEIESQENETSQNNQSLWDIIEETRQQLHKHIDLTFNLLQDRLLNIVVDQRSSLQERLRIRGYSLRHGPKEAAIPYHVIQAMTDVVRPGRPKARRMYCDIGDLCEACDAYIRKLEGATRLGKIAKAICRHTPAKEKKN